MANTLERYFSLRDRVVLITGGYGYLGEVATRGLAEAGATVVVLGRDSEKFKSRLSDCKNVYFQLADVADTTSVVTAFAEVVKNFGRFDVLINNAHYGQPGAIDKVSDEAWAVTLDGTVGNYHRCIREALPYFRRKASGTIINVSSMYGMVAPDFEAYEGYPNFTNPPHYGAGKAAVLQLTRYYASLLGKENIRVNALSPGPFPNKKVQEAEKFINELARRTALNRIGQPEELVAGFIFLAGPGVSYLTGHNLVIDGGWTIK